MRLIAALVVALAWIAVVLLVGWVGDFSLWQLRKTVAAAAPYDLTDCGLHITPSGIMYCAPGDEPGTVTVEPGSPVVAIVYWGNGTRTVVEPGERLYAPGARATISDLPNLGQQVGFVWSRAEVWGGLILLAVAATLIARRTR